jgi:putative DNA primase/helicase
MNRTEQLIAAALAYRDNHHWVPLRLKGKSPNCMGAGWQNRTLTDAIPEFEPTDNIGILLGKASGGLIRLDPDFAVIDAVTNILFPEPTAITGRASSPRSGRFYICEGLDTTNFKLSSVMKNDPRMPIHDGKRSAVVYQILSTGTQTMAPPSIHPETGEEVAWQNPGIESAVITKDELLWRVGIEAFCMAVRQFWPALGSRNEAAMALARVLLEALASRDEAERIAIVDELVVAVAMAGGDGEASRDGKERARTTLEKMKAGEETTGLTKLVELLELPEACIKTFRKWLGLTVTVVRLEQDGVVTLAPPFSEEMLALRFATRHENELRYVAAWHKWLQWNGKIWCQDETREVFSLARVLCRETAIQANRGANTIASAKTRAAVVALAGEDRRLAADVAQWDADLWLLNTPSGVIDLENGEQRSATPNDYLTKITAVGPGNDCPLWHAFLKRVTKEDAALEKFLQRVAGYALTGVTHEHAMFFLHGLGANGKTVFINTISGVMGDYHKTAPIETFTVSMSDRHPTELAMLRGARLVTAIETEENRPWAESRIKQLTGGDPIAARFMRQDFFEYVPQFKLMIAGNHKPGLRSVDEAIRRRMNMIPFSVTIPKEERDAQLAEKLQKEWPGILQWMIDGCLAWQDDGLAPPAAVTTATSEYLEGEDIIKAWLDDCCKLDPEEWCAIKELFASFKKWAETCGETVGTIRRFGQRLGSRFARLERDDKGFLGLTIYLPKEEGVATRRRIWEPPM